MQSSDDGRGLGIQSCVMWIALAALVLVSCGRKSAEVHPQPTTTQTPSVAASAPVAPKIQAGANCPFPERIDKDVTIPSGCVADVVRNALVESGNTLTIEPGVILRFHPATYLEVGQKGSRLVARGTKERPIVLTSVQKEKRPGDWVGIVIDDAPGVGTSIEHAIVEYAGRESHGGEGALTMFGPAPEGRVSVRDTIFRHHLQAGVANRHPNASFAAFERNRFEDCAFDVRVTAPVLGSFGPGNVFGGGIQVLGGTIARATTWPTAKMPFLLTEPLYVNGTDKTPASLSFAPDSVVKLAKQTWIEVGTTGPGSLTASRVTFTSAAEKPAAGDWVGLLFGEHTRASSISMSRIEYAGAEEHGGDGAITLVGSKSLKVTDLSLFGITFKAVAQAHVSTNGDGCEQVLDPRTGHVFWAGVEACR